ncbi:response regulator [bacterium]|nr:response regulator [bacterium]
MKNRTLLIVDGDPKNLRILKSHFTDSGYQVDEASVDEEALRLISQKSYDAILTDLSGAQIDGLKILEALQNDPRKNAAVFFLTAKNDVWNRVTSFKRGAKDFIVKPVHVREIAARVQMVLDRLERRQSASHPAPALSGRLQDFSLSDLLQILKDEKKTGTLMLYNDNNLNGQMGLHNGILVHAVSGALQSNAAVDKMMSWRKGRFSMRFTPVEKTVAVQQEGHLSQGAQRMEQREELLQQLPSLESVLVTTSNFKKIVSQKTLAGDLDYFISLFDGKRTLGRIINESTYDEITSLSRILKLYQLGFLCVAKKQPELPSAAADRGIPPVERPSQPKQTEKPVAETWPEEAEEETVVSLQQDALNSLDQEELDRSQTEPELEDKEDETELAVQHDFADDGISELLTKDLSQWRSDSGYDKDLFYELRSAAEKQPGFQTPPAGREPVEDDSQLLFPTLEMLEQEHPADALLTLPGESAFPSQEPTVPLDLTPPPAEPPRQPARRSKEQGAERFTPGYGHILVLGSDEKVRRHMVASLTANRVFVKTYDNPEWSDLIYGAAEFKGGHSLNILSLSLEKEFSGVLEYFSRSLLGYLLLIDTMPGDWNYKRYLIQALKGTLAVPSMIIIPAQLSISSGFSEHDWRIRLGLPDDQLFAAHVEFDPITCKRFIFRLIETYYRKRIVNRKNRLARSATI